jgi:hypothetical protein
MSLTDAMGKAVVTGAKLKASGAANEANTKALMIEPLLAALGWDPTDLDVVEREVKVYDGTFLDYGLKADGSPRLYVEAKAIGESVTDKKAVAQAVNYATTTVWCGACSRTGSSGACSRQTRPRPWTGNCSSRSTCRMRLSQPRTRPSCFV